ncbi:hypothetical protein SS1G_04377 [Sclerotinia sclerotiorum 1980 UF-70]|uniref:FAD-binding domain-containing protein n=2 Tax=Sclerotinia sclerotiorum (strain ATCC 18683 / 1980 / Ss-1) TaxID=665079 RepID=A7EGD6_SCLS1|nr:hypothetical protein SS1G_04377 [Sclerotinia sclerotiorum 1980 UF-70]APA06953.1 hypothetical protein sscle_02g017230 [Sclerotinia sclerotiorum 1980 UF-70]EDO01902.1 hypothetical protein SS1G_04377 [Sclerotinia sclerotiorum 1980 UF-70]
MSSDMKVLIIGAGTTGLLIAQGLKKAGISFEIFERLASANPTERARDWSMALHWGSKHLSTCLPDEIFAKIKSAQCDPYYEKETMPPLPFKNAQTGEILLTLPADNLRRVGRQKLRKLFAEGLQIQYNKRLTSFTASDTDVTVTFEDGTSATGTHLVGADGARSLLRTTLLGDKGNLTPMPYTLYNMKTTYTAEQALYLKNNPAFHPIMNFGTNHELKSLVMLVALDVVDKEKPETWVFQLLCSFLQEDPVRQAQATALSSQERLEILQSNVELWTDPWKSAIKWLTEGTEVPADICTLWKDPVQWDNHHGRVTIAGDSAHPMPPHRGQGLNNAIQDAANYVKAIRNINEGKISSEEAISAYDLEVLERGKLEISISAASAVATHDIDCFNQGPLVKIGIKQPNAGDETVVTA